MPDIQPRDNEIGIAEAFGRLPLETPDRSAWPLLAERIAAAPPRSRPRPRWPFLLATAAVLALAAVMPGLLNHPVPTGPATPDVIADTTSADVSLQALMSESAQLEYLIGAVSNDEMASANAAALGLEFEERLQRLDTALSDPRLDPDNRSLLWQRRVALLRDYAGLLGTTQWLAAQGDRLDGALVATY